RNTLEIAEAVEDLRSEIANVSRQTSRETFELLGGGRYKVRAATRRGGRGLSGDLILLDELREHQKWDAWSALTKTTMARALSLVLAMSNAGDTTSVVLRHLRRQAHYDLGDPDGICKDPVTGESLMPELPEEALDAEDYDEEEPAELGLFEWSAPPGCSKWDRDGWAQANPSMGYVPGMERKIAGAAKTDPEWDVRTEVLCQWSSGPLQGPLEAGKWEAGYSTEEPPAGTPLVLGVDVSVGRSPVTHVVAAYYMPDGLPQVSLEASRPGTEWLVDWLAAQPGHLRIAAQANGAPVSALLEDLDELENVTVERWGGPELGNGTVKFSNLVGVSEHDEDTGMRTGLRHMPAPALDLAAGTAVPAILGGGGTVWDRKRSPTDVAPLVAATAAVWLLLRPAPARRRSVYEDRGVVTV